MATVPVPAAALLRRSALYLTLLVPLIAVGFWPSYFARALDEPQWRIHAHGALMFSWVALLLAQAFLVRANRRPLHRRLGRVSFVLVPLIVLSSLSVAHWRFNHPANDPFDTLAYFLYVQVALLAQFVVAWSLAMANRAQPLVHARYMLCTALAIVDPIVARLLFTWFAIDWPQAQVVTFALVDGVLLLLMARDIANRFPRPVFPRMLALFLVAQAPTFFVYDTAGWKSFVAAFAALPLP